ncbi:MAG TPA: VWA domain-containing protein [Burkholderiaceae bacterium]|nr:VWA domain-containing protein [Burkholderiaceae bacterium]
MTFLWPEALWLLLALPACAAAWAWLLRRRKAAVRYASLALVRDALGGRAGLRRYVPPLLFALALAAAIAATARPTAVLRLPSQQQTIVLAIDVSLSMRARDVMPDRITAAQAAAKAFVEGRPAFARIGLVAFGGSAQLVQRPTDRVDELVAAIERLQLQRHTATGSALVAALGALLPDEDPDLLDLGSGAAPSRGRAIDDPRPTRPTPAPVAPGSYRSGVIVLLSDGRRTTGPDPVAVATRAADLGVRVFTVGFGSRDPTADTGERWSMQVVLDEETLRQVAQITRGEYFHAGSASELAKVYEQLNTRFVLERGRTEITALFAATAALLLAAAGALSLAWFGRGA